jgi:integrase
MTQTPVDAKPPTINALSLGAGVQSSALLLMSAHGLLPKVDYAAFADTGWERPETYAALDRLENEVAKPAGIEIVRLKAGDIRRDALDPNSRFSTMPMFIRNPNGSKGMLRRQCAVICTLFRSLSSSKVTSIEELGMDVRRQLADGLVGLPRVGAVVKVPRGNPPCGVLDREGAEVAAVSEYLRDLMLGDCSEKTALAYANDLLRWFRLLWVLDVAWDKATEAEVAVMVGWLREADNPQRRRQDPNAPRPGAVNLRTGKPNLPQGYARSTINRALSAISGFYAFHAHQGAGPVVNPVPVSMARRRALAHCSPLETKAVTGRARLRQKTVEHAPRAIPDALWEELFAAMGCDRDRALLEMYVSSGARAEELLGLGIEDVDWAGQRLYVISKGTGLRQPVPASPTGFVYLARYLDEVGTPVPGQPLWRTRHGKPGPLSYTAIRRILQRANAKCGTNWSLHDTRHTACTRMANDPKLTLAEVQTIMRHADISTTGRYQRPTVEAMFDKLAEHYATPPPQPHYPNGYDLADVQAVFGA